MYSAAYLDLCGRHILLLRDHLTLYQATTRHSTAHTPSAEALVTGMKQTYVTLSQSSLEAGAKSVNSQRKEHRTNSVVRAAAAITCQNSGASSASTLKDYLPGTTITTRLFSSQDSRSVSLNLGRYFIHPFHRHGISAPDYTTTPQLRAIYTRILPFTPSLPITLYSMSGSELPWSY